MNEVYISVLNDFINKKSNETEDNILELKKRSYENWALNELMELFIQEYFIPPHITGKVYRTPIDLIDEFIDTMDYYSTLSEKEEVNLQFDIAKNIGETVILLFL
ncbi:MAG: hypothetical protein R3Y12_04280 [Clostridia bacterium]